MSPVHEDETGCRLKRFNSLFHRPQRCVQYIHPIDLTRLDNPHPVADASIMNQHGKLLSHRFRQHLAVPHPQKGFMGLAYHRGRDDRTGERATSRLINSCNES